MFYYYINDNLNKTCGIDNNLNWFILNYFYEPINNNKDQVIIIFFLLYQDW